MSMAMLSASRLTVGYGARVLLENVSFDLSKGEFVLLCGANGSGKSTLMRALASNASPAVSKKPEGSKLILVPTGILRPKGFTLREFIVLSQYDRLDFAGRIRPEIEESASAAMEMMSIEDLAERDVSTLSDGEFQKGCIASALARKADFLLLDEPTAYLDVDGKAEVLSCLRELCDKGAIGIIMASHDVQMAMGYCTRVFGISVSSEFLDSATGGDKAAVLDSCFKNPVLGRSDF